MDGVAVYGVDVTFLVVVEDAVSPEGSGTNNVLCFVSLSASLTVRQSQLTLLVKM